VTPDCFWLRPVDSRAASVPIDSGFRPYFSRVTCFHDWSIAVVLRQVPADFKNYIYTYHTVILSEAERSEESSLK
jgi:hypothetical protein